MSKFLLFACLFGLATPLLEDDGKLTVAFGSCNSQNKNDGSSWGAALAYLPDVFAFIGDNIYGDTTDVELFREKYETQWSKKGLQIMKNAVSLFTGIWDDHDFGDNDLGVYYSEKNATRDLFCEFFEYEDEERCNRDTGIYTSYTMGSEDTCTVQMIFPDLRWNRDPLETMSDEEYAEVAAPIGAGPYIPTANTSKAFLGEEQWKWLEEVLSEQADIRLFFSSIQLLNDESGWETWSNFPHEKQRLIDLIDKTKAEGVIMFSGDTHWSELTLVTEDVPYPMYEMTSSGMTETWCGIPPNRNRLGPVHCKRNVGIIEIDCNYVDPRIALKVVDSDTKAIQLETQLRQSMLTFPDA